MRNIFLVLVMIAALNSQAATIDYSAKRTCTIIGVTYVPLKPPMPLIGQFYVGRDGGRIPAPIALNEFIRMDHDQPVSAFFAHMVMFDPVTKTRSQIVAYNNLYFNPKFETSTQVYFDGGPSAAHSAENPDDGSTLTLTLVGGIDQSVEVKLFELDLGDTREIKILCVKN